MDKMILWSLILVLIAIANLGFSVGHIIASGCHGSDEYQYGYNTGSDMTAVTATCGEFQCWLPGYTYIKSDGETRMMETLAAGRF